jgi:hypothetical protein
MYYSSKTVTGFNTVIFRETMTLKKIKTKISNIKKTNFRIMGGGIILVCSLNHPCIVAQSTSIGIYVKQFG